MRITRILVFLIAAPVFICLTPSLGRAEEFSGELITGFSFFPRHLGAKSLGFSKEFQNSFHLDYEGRRILYVSSSLDQNPETRARGVSYLDSGVGGGINIPLRHFSFSGAFNNSSFSSGNNFRGYGMYMGWRDDPRHPALSFKLGSEMDSNNTRWIFGTGSYALTDALTLSAGSSWNKLAARPAEIRTGIAATLYLPNFWNHQIFAAVIPNITVGEVATVWGIGRVAPSNPAYFLIYRKKPEAEYFLGILAFGSKTLTRRVQEGMFSSFWTGALQKTRIVENRDFDVFGVGYGRSEEFGKTTFRFSFSNANITPHLKRFSDFESMTVNFTDIGWFTSTGIGISHSGSDTVAVPKGILETRYNHQVGVPVSGYFQCFTQQCRIEFEPTVNMRSGTPGIGIIFSISF